MAAPRLSPAWRASLALLVALAAGCGFAPAKLAQAQPPAAKDPPSAPARTGTTPYPFGVKVKAPPLTGGREWLNTSGPIDIEDLRGKFVILDFWTYCCINCIHTLPELKKLERAYPNQLVIIGVHSAKFTTEEDTRNIAEAIRRYEIEHPVVNDADHKIWNRYNVNSWPSFRVIDPEGNVVAADSGEQTFEVLDAFMKRALPYYRERGLLDERPLHFDLELHRAERTPLRYPGKVHADEASGRLFIADSNHNRIVVTKFDGSLLEVIGSGRIGNADGAFNAAEFNKPQGMALVGDTLYIADTENHLLRAADLKARTVRTVAGRGIQGRGPTWGFSIDQLVNRPPGARRWAGRPLETNLASPWDLLAFGPNLYIAMAGPHQIWTMPLDESEIGPFAGNGREDIVDGDLLPTEPFEAGYSSFAQPSGLATDGRSLFVADSEGSSIRSVPLSGIGKVTTVLGTANLDEARLFTFGDLDGPLARARLQHVLGVAWYGDRLYVADTYNDKIKAIDPKSRTIRTIAGGAQPGRTDDPPLFDEPAGIAAAAGLVFVADTNNHLIRVIDIKTRAVRTLTIAGLAAPAAIDTVGAVPERDATVTPVAPERAVKVVDGHVELTVNLDLPEGFKVNPLAPLRYKLAADGPAGPLGELPAGWTKVTPPDRVFRVRIPVAAATGRARVRLVVQYFYCKDGKEGVCLAESGGFIVPLSLAADAGEPLPLVLTPPQE